MVKTFKKAIAIAMTLVFILSLVPFSAMAEDAESKTTAKFTFTGKNTGENADRVDFGYVRTSKPAQWFQKAQYTGKTTGDLYYGINLSSLYRPFAQIDLSGYEEILKNDSTTIYMRLQRRGTDAAYNLPDHWVYFAPDNCDFIDFSSDATMNWTVAQAAGFNKEDNLFYVDSDGVEGSVASSGEISPANLINALDSNPSNSKVSLYIKGKGNNVSGDSGRISLSSDTYFAINYVKSEIDNQDYVDDLAEEFSWADVSTQNKNAVESDLVLPASYRGADITWSSDDEAVIESDGTVHIGIGEKSATLTATLSYKGIEESAQLATATRDFEINVVSEETKTVTLPYVNYAHARTDYPDSSQKYTTNKDHGQHYIQAGGIWRGFAQFNLAGYEEILNNPNTKLQFKIRAGNGFSSKLYPFKVYLAPSSANGYEQASVTYNSAKALGIFDTTRPLLAQSDGTTYVGNGSWITVDADKEALLQVLNETGNNGFVTMWFAPTANSQIRIKEKGEETTNGGLIITYYESEIDDKAHFEAVKSDFGWDKLTADSTESLTNDLPTYFRGAKITWSADVPGVVAADGKVTQYIDKENTIKLTANVEYKGYSFSETFNNVTVPKEELKSVVVPLNYGTYISSNARSKPQGEYDSSYYSRYMYPIGLYPNGNDRLVFLNWDFSDVLAQLNAARSISINLKSVMGHTQAGAGSKFSVLPDGYEDWTESTLTYDMAVEKGMYTEQEVAFANCSPLKISEKFQEITSSAEILNGIKKSIADSPDDGLVNFRWEAIGQTPTEYRLENNNKNNFTITLYYYESELESGDELVNSKVESMPWSFISNQAIDKVVADLSLPETFYGADVTWESSNESVITSSGEVIPGDEDTAVTLTATVNGLKKEFKVTVPANTDFVLDSKQADYVSATVWAKEACDSCVLVVATYIDDTLYEVDVRDKNFTLAKGENFIWTKLIGDEPGEVVKVMLLKDMETITPLAIAK